MCHTVFFEIPYTNKLWICFVDFHFCIFSCKRSIEKEYSYIIWKCFFFFMGGTEWLDYFNTGAWNHHCDVYICPMGTTTYLLWCIYTSRGIQRVNKNRDLWLFYHIFVNVELPIPRYLSCWLLKQNNCL